MLAREMPERVLFMTGEAGIGKSTLLSQLIAELVNDAANGDTTRAATPIIATAECSTPVAGSGVGFVEALKPFADIMSGLVESGVGGKGAKKGSGRKFKLDIGKFSSIQEAQGACTACRCRAGELIRRSPLFR